MSMSPNSRSMAKPVVFLLLLGMIYTTDGTSCDICTTTYESSIASASDSQKCIAAKSYLACLAGATEEAGCDKRAEKMKVAQDEVTRVNALSSETCVLTDSCECQTTFYMSNLRDQVSNCYASVVQDLCAISASGLACDDVTTNAVYSVSTSSTWVNACSGQESLRGLSLRVAILVATVAALINAQ
ncbi:uncharacterized protein LOC124259199 [Haliotis rubra]|uniref:uncharacterized protein LOC124259199 n=1 Tax=Haliotis rubra TaxID=36100 RepID=UPI001EE58D51|nr:uncharacterized protein LOC124259199 [Haliotis rubra]